MKKILVILVIFAAAATCLNAAASPAQAAFNAARWPKAFPVETGDASKGYALVEMNGPLYDAALPDFRDVRVGRSEGGTIEEVPFDMVGRSGTPRERKLTAALINRGASDKNSTATVDLGTGVSTHNHLIIGTQSRDFIKEVAIEGSDDHTTWIKIRSSGKIADISSAGQVFHNTGVTYDTVDYRYLRITLSGGTGETVGIDSIDVLFADTRTDTERSVELKILSQAVSAKDGTSTVVLTGGFGHLPVHRLVFLFDSGNFSRSVMVYGSADMKEWTPAGKGTVASFALPDYKDSQLSVPIDYTGYRYLKVVIRNGDSPALKLSGVTGYYFPRYVLFPCKPGGLYSIFVGNTAAGFPEYDIRDFSARVMEANPPVWRLLAPQANPLYKPAAKVVPASEKHKWLLPGMLAVLVAGLALFIFRALPKVMKDQ